MEQTAIDFTAPPARARRTDPDSSHAAADRVNKTGKAAVQRAKVFALVEATPGLTSAELAERHREDRSMIARRLPELREKKLVRTDSRECRVNGSKALTWWPT